MQEETVKSLVAIELPFLALEKAMMWLTEAGFDRQIAHAKIREVALRAREVQRVATVRIEDMLADPIFDQVGCQRELQLMGYQVRARVESLADDPLQFTGRCCSQTETFIHTCLRPRIAPYLEGDAGTKMVLDV